jgi:ASC-1-like (ASCH) protein
MPNYHQCKLARRYFNDICSGKKTTEGRINRDKFRNFKANDIIEFVCADNPDDVIICTITAVNNYKSFREMLEQEGIQKCLPGIRKISEGVKIYHQIPGYEEGAKDCGVLGIRIKLS